MWLPQTPSCTSFIMFLDCSMLTHLSKGVVKPCLYRTPPTIAYWVASLLSARVGDLIIFFCTQDGFNCRHPVLFVNRHQVYFLCHYAWLLKCFENHRSETPDFFMVESFANSSALLVSSQGT